MAPTLRARKPPSAPATAPVAPQPAPKAAKPKAKATPKPKPEPKKKAATTAIKGKATAVGAKAKAAPKPKAAKAAPKSAAKRGKAAPKTTAVAAPLLDHKAYPHIFDRIIGFAPHASLLKLRATSHTLLERCDARLARHIVLGPGLPPPKGKKWEATAPHLPRGPDKKRARQHRVHLSSALGELPGWVCDLNHITDWAEDSCGEQCDTLRARWLEYFADDTRVLDIHPWAHSGQKFERARKIFEGKTVRFYPYETERLPVKATDIVIFTSFTPPDGVDGVDWTRVTTAPSVYLDSEPPVQRAVFHARFDCRRPTLTECWVNMPTQFGGWCWPNAVLILEPEPGTPVEPNKEWDTTRPRPNGVLWDVANMLRVGSTTSWTIVGASEIPHQICGLTHNPKRTHAGFADSVTNNVLEWIREDYAGRIRTEELTEDREEEIRSQLRFLTNAEYRAEVGEEQWAIDAVRTVKLV
jgi:hypothetical protein